MKAAETKAGKIRHIIGTYALMTIATSIVAVGVHFFKYPNNFVLGGVTGLSVLIGKLGISWLTPANFVAIANIILLIIGFIFLGKSFGGKTVYCSLLLSGLLQVFARVAPLSGPLTNQPLMELFFAVILSAIGAAVIFNLGGSTGGSDIIAMILRKYFKIEIGKALMIADLLIVAGSFFAFGIQTGLFSLFGVIIATLIIDTSVENLNMSKYFMIITSKPDEISEYITAKLDRGATRWAAEGCYTHENKAVILVVMNRSQARRLRADIKKIDPDCFILISNTSDIIGKGFRQSI